MQNLKEGTSSKFTPCKSLEFFDIDVSEQVTDSIDFIHHIQKIVCRGEILVSQLKGVLPVLDKVVRGW